ncbi:MAG TPA: DUF2905 domain-containing protein [Burkholderiales bacterium]|nr:DUF2905 domain-containing protein [Burkholderiales bacterium]
MAKWLVTLFVVLAILSVAMPRSARFAWGRLPGDLRIPLRGRVLYIPFTSTVLLSAAVWLLGRLI